MPVFKVECILTFDGPDEETVADQIIDVTEMVACEMEDEGRPVEFVGFSVTSVEEADG